MSNDLFLKNEFLSISMRSNCSCRFALIALLPITYTKSSEPNFWYVIRIANKNSICLSLVDWALFSRQSLFFSQINNLFDQFRYSVQRCQFLVVLILLFSVWIYLAYFHIIISNSMWKNSLKIIHIQTRCHQDETDMK